MVTIELNVSYPGLNEAEIERLRVALRQEMLHACFRAASTVKKDDGSFLLSTKLNVDGSAKTMSVDEAREIMRKHQREVDLDSPI